MRPATLREAYVRIGAGEPWPKALGEFLHTFYTAETTAARVAMLAEAPPLGSDPRLDALAGGIAEYLFKRWTRIEPPPWMSERTRYLKEPWFVTESSNPAVREYLTYASPPEFKSRNIMTDEAPLRRATTPPR